MVDRSQNSQLTTGECSAVNSAETFSHCKLVLSSCKVPKLLRKSYGNGLDLLPIPFGSSFVP